MLYNLVTKAIRLWEFEQGLPRDVFMPEFYS